MRKIVALFLSFFLVFIPFLISQTINKKSLEISKSFVKEALTSEWGYYFLKELSALGPRLSGSENSLKALFWAKSKIEKMGFSKVWLQPTLVDHWERGDIEKAEMILPDGKSIKLHICALGTSVGTNGKWLYGKIIEVKSFRELQKIKDKVKGKIVFFNRPMEKELVDTFKAYARAVNQRTAGASEAAKYGAIAVIIVRSVTTKYDNNPHTGLVSYKKDIKKIPAIAIGLKDADLLSQNIKKFPELKVRVKLNCKNLPLAKSYNLIAEIKGSEKPEEVIVLGGHFDSWDLGDGAVDDGSGCVQSLEVLHLFKKLNIKPKRTIRVIFYMNEEFGSKNSGAYTYGEYVKKSKETHIAAIESDRGAAVPRGFTINTKDELIKQKVISWLPYLKIALIDWIKPGGSGADVSKIKGTKAQFGYVPDVQRYFDYHHSANDRFSAIHPREFELGSAAMAILTYLISEYGL